MPLAVISRVSTSQERSMKRFLVAAATVVAAVGTVAVSGCAVRAGQSSVGEYVDDKAIVARVNTRFASDSEVSAMRIQVESLNGVVQLSGFATSQAEKDKAAEIARQVPNVKSVRNDIIVRRP
jgi:osmotically-inducible protein OsmY